MTAKGNIETIHQTRGKERVEKLFSLILLIVHSTVFLINFLGCMEANRFIANGDESIQSRSVQR